MPKFRFRLERVLSVRQHQEEKERMAFAAATQRKVMADRALAEAREKLRLAVENAAVISAGRPTIEDLVRSHEYRLALLRREDEAVRAVESSKVILEEVRRRLVEARRKRRVLERLREKSHEKWRFEEETREQNELDEIGLVTFIREHAAEEAA